MKTFSIKILGNFCEQPFFGNNQLTFCEFMRTSSVVYFSFLYGLSIVKIYDCRSKSEYQHTKQRNDASCSGWHSVHNVFRQPQICFIHSKPECSVLFHSKSFFPETAGRKPQIPTFQNGTQFVFSGCSIECVTSFKSDTASSATNCDHRIRANVSEGESAVGRICAIDECDDLSQKSESAKKKKKKKKA
jgi:hypothetical protein